MQSVQTEPKARHKAELLGYPKVYKSTPRGEVCAKQSAYINYQNLPTADFLLFNFKRAISSVCELLTFCSFLQTAVGAHFYITFSPPAKAISFFTNIAEAIPSESGAISSPFPSMMFSMKYLISV